MPGPDAIVLVGMSVREVDARERLLALAREYAGRAGARAGCTVAFLQQGDPSLASELTRLADLGTGRIVLVGVSLGSLAPATSWLRRIAGHWWRERPGLRPEIAVAPALLEREDQLEDQLEALLARVRPVTGTEAALTSAAWDAVPTHRHQVLVCRGPRCTARGSDRTAEALVLALMAEGLEDDDVLVTQTGCQFPCNHAPVVSVQPDDVWYGGVDAGAAGTIVAEHLAGGRPVEGIRLARRRGPQRGLG